MLRGRAIAHRDDQRAIGFARGRQKHTIQIRIHGTSMRGIEPWTGIEPVTCRLRGGCSTNLSYKGGVRVLVGCCASTSEVNR